MFGQRYIPEHKQLSFVGVWKSLVVFDKRDVTTSDGMFQSVVEHLRFTTNNGRIIPTITIFPQRIPGKTGPLIWNSQVIRYL